MEGIFLNVIHSTKTLHERIMINSFLPQEIQKKAYIIYRCELWRTETLNFAIEQVDTRVKFPP